MVTPPPFSPEPIRMVEKHVASMFSAIFLNVQPPWCSLRLPIRIIFHLHGVLTLFLIKAKPASFVWLPAAIFLCMFCFANPHCTC
uniref:Uncharacterized protein n=1 Tax=Arundo donax TaxID=35708 RepID=A0A0A8YXD9_ARUDO